MPFELYLADRDEAVLRGLRIEAVSSCVIFSAATLGLLAVTRTSLAASSVAIIALYLLGGGSLYARYTKLRPDPYLASIIGGLTILVWAGFVAGTTALAALRTGAPLFDNNLARVDAMLGVHTPTVVAWLARHHAMVLLAPAYRSTVPLLFAAAVVLALMRREAAMWELCLSFTACAAACTLLSAVVPAAGAFVHYSLPSEVIGALPQKAGNYYLEVFNSYRSGGANTIDINHFEGVVTFPSFHTSMALMLAYSLRSVRWLYLPACVWSSLTVLATMPMGGHYFADIVAGAGVWALSVLPYRRLLRSVRVAPALRVRNA